MEIAQMVYQQDFEGKEYRRAIKDIDDCNSIQTGFNRVFCDLHCIRDAVKAGDKAILKSLEKGVNTVGQNMDLLLEYYTGTVTDMIDEKFPDLLQQKATEVKETRKSLHGMFTEMKGMLQGNL